MLNFMLICTLFLVALLNSHEYICFLLLLLLLLLSSCDLVDGIYDQVILIFNLNKLLFYYL